MRARATTRPAWCGSPRQINKAVDDYVAEHVKGKRAKANAEVRIVRNLCIDTFKAEPIKTLITPWTKFHLAIDAWSSYCFDERSLWQNQAEAFTMKDWMTLVLGRGLTGQSLTLEQVPEWFKAHYSASRVAWFTRFQTHWNKRRLSISACPTGRWSRRVGCMIFTAVSGNWRLHPAGRALLLHYRFPRDDAVVARAPVAVAPAALCLGGDDVGRALSRLHGGRDERPVPFHL